MDECAATSLRRGCLLLLLLLLQHAALTLAGKAKRNGLPPKHPGPPSSSAPSSNIPKLSFPQQIPNTKLNPGDPHPPPLPVFGVRSTTHPNDLTHIEVSHGVGIPPSQPLNTVPLPPGASREKLLRYQPINPGTHISSNIVSHSSLVPHPPRAVQDNPFHTSVYIGDRSVMRRVKDGKHADGLASRGVEAGLRQTTLFYDPKVFQIRHGYMAPSMGHVQNVLQVEPAEGTGRSLSPGKRVQMIPGRGVERDGEDRRRQSAQGRGGGGDVNAEKQGRLATAENRVAKGSARSRSPSPVDQERLDHERRRSGALAGFSGREPELAPV